jgi:hypothetical protein
MSISSLITGGFLDGIKGLILEGLESGTPLPPPPTVTQHGGGPDASDSGSKKLPSLATAYLKYEENVAREAAEKAALEAKAVRARLEARRKEAITKENNARLAAEARRDELLLHELNFKRQELEQTYAALQAEIKMQDDEEDLLLITMIANPFIH